MGDDAIRSALEAVLPGLDLVPLPLTLRAAPKVAPRARRLRESHLLLGGGTTVGRRNWRLPLLANLSLVGRRPLLMLGAGVEDPVFQGRHSFSSGGELRRWVPLLREFDRVTVRGPRSARLLWDAGVEAAVVGDPALLLRPPLVEVETGLLGVNLGYGSDLWSHSQLTVLKEVAPVLRHLARAGWRFRFLIANLEDAQWTRFCVALAQLPSGSYEEVIAVRPEVYLAAVAPCELLVGQRLHAVVLAAAAGVPSVMLEYQPKCRDFMESIGAVERSLRTDRLRARALLEVVETLAADRLAAALDLTERVDGYRNRLGAEVERVAAVIGAGPGG
jgi:polysaccharide pyruvyl transferase WcaK-like protein